MELNKALEETIEQVFGFARSHRHEYVTLEHLLYGLLSNEDVLAVLHACDADVELLKKKTQEFLDEHAPVVAEGSERGEEQITLGFRRVFQRAMFHVRSSSKADSQQTTGVHILIALFSEQNCHAVHFLNEQGVDRLRVTTYVSHGKLDPDRGVEGEGSDEDTMDGVGSGRQKGAHSNPDDGGMGAADKRDPKKGRPGEKDKKASLLAEFAVNLNQLALEGKIDPLVGRERELRRLAQVLCRRRKNNAILAGESGVGKTAIVDGLALQIVTGKAPAILAESVIYALDMGSLLAGTRYRGDFEQRFKGVLQALQRDQKAIVFIDEIHTVIGAGAASGGVLDGANLLKPLLTTGQLRCIGATTYKEYSGIFERDRALSRRFQKIDIVEPDNDETFQILKGLREGFQKHHTVRYSDRALRFAVELADRHLRDRHMPDKAIDVLDEAGAHQRLLPPSRRVKLIGQSQIRDVVADMARVPIQKVSSSDKEKLAGLSARLKGSIFEQDEAISSLVSAIMIARAGLSANQTPTASFLFAGPTGVGKTEVCRQLALALEVPLIRYDMSEYMERHTVSRLIGAPPGYVGYDQGGLLTGAVMRQPHCVLLMDEIEKAHPEVYDLLLQVMDHGTLTDSNGREVDFRNVILVMTSNAGAGNISRRSMGFTLQDHSSEVTEVINRLFPPEFRNRLDAIIQFAPLSQEAALKVIGKFLGELQDSLNDKKVTLKVGEEVRRWLLGKGYDEAMGARPMARVIREHLKKPLAEMLLLGEAEGAQVIVVEVGDDDKLRFSAAESESN